MKTDTSFIKNPFFISWILALLFYALEYAVRSSPSVMIGQLQSAYGVGSTEVSSLASAYYISYSITSLAAGLLLDRMGARKPVFFGILVLAVGCLFFGGSHYIVGYAGRLMQGMGSAMAFPAAVYIAVKAFSGKNLATAIGITQTLGMLGGSAGQKLSNTYLTNGNSVHSIWIIFGASSLILALLAFLFTPKSEPGINTEKQKNFLDNYKIIFANPQSYLSGLVSGLLFAPTTIFAMIWGVDFLQKSRGLSQESATVACALVPIGWAIGCPLLGWIADRIKRKIPVIIGGAVLMILSVLQLAYLPSLISENISLLLMGIGSGAAMIPYSIIKEVNPDQVKGSAAGAINFLTFGVTTLLAPLFSKLFGSKLAGSLDTHSLLQHSLLFFVIGIICAIVITIFLKETGNLKPEEEQ
ncbi:MFS transporter [Epilithonimonas tenax]|uniref:MFS transporter n=1 Tax=Epilithonimonas tenax TaxID=191577 RepID=UPI0004896179|nr:MFS transporter [Epilithonimonas tenax]